MSPHTHTHTRVSLPVASRERDALKSEVEQLRGRMSQLDSVLNSAVQDRDAAQREVRCSHVNSHVPYLCGCVDGISSAEKQPLATGQGVSQVNTCVYCSGSGPFDFTWALGDWP